METLVRKIDKGSEFTLTTTPDTTSFSFKIGAAGEFVVDWGDGTVETITKANTTTTTYSHNYATAGTYTIGISGQATAHITNAFSATTISFYVNSSQTKIASIDGSLGAIFGTLTDGSQPKFVRTFYGCSGLTSIPENLFGNISGTAQSRMFKQTFYDCTSLTGPSARINGQYLYEIWPDATSTQVRSMYYNATGLSDYSSIPSAWK